MSLNERPVGCDNSQRGGALAPRGPLGNIRRRSRPAGVRVNSDVLTDAPAELIELIWTASALCQTALSGAVTAVVMTGLDEASRLSRSTSPEKSRASSGLRTPAAYPFQRTCGAVAFKVAVCLLDHGAEMNELDAAIFRYAPLRTKFEFSPLDEGPRGSTDSCRFSFAPKT
jgi:hypothetical protein